MFRSTWRWCWKTPCWETQSMQAYNWVAKKVPAVTGLHLYNAKSPRTRQSRSKNLEECPRLLCTVKPRCDVIVLAMVTLLRGRHSQTAYVHAIMIPYNNCLWLSCILTQHTTVCITIMPEWIDYCSSTHSQTDMYHNSWTPPIPACNGDTCRPHPCLLMCYQLLIRYDVPSYIYQVVLLYCLSC